MLSRQTDNQTYKHGRWAIPLFQMLQVSLNILKHKKWWVTQNPKDTGWQTQNIVNDPIIFRNTYHLTTMLTRKTSIHQVIKRYTQGTNMRRYRLTDTHQILDTTQSFPYSSIRVTKQKTLTRTASIHQVKKVLHTTRICADRRKDMQAGEVTE